MNEDNGFIKVGIGKNPKQRMKALQTGSTAKLKIIYEREVEFASKIENVLHRHFKEQQVHGEWFDLFGVDINDIDKQIESSEKNFILLKEYENPFV
jgi:hypothetical protein